MLEEKWALLVEDDAHSLVAISSILRDLGVRFKRNTTGVNVAQQLDIMNPTPDFILLDIDLASGGAFGIQRQMKIAVPGIPVIAFGMAQDFALRQRVRGAGFAAYFPKPLPRRQFGDLLGRILDGDNLGSS